MSTRTLPFADIRVKPLGCNLQNFFPHNAEMERHERLKRARARRFRTAKAASDFLAIPYGTLTGHESGARGIKRGEIVRYAKAYGVELPWLEHALGPEMRRDRRSSGARDVNSWRPSYLDLLLFPLFCETPDCGADFNIAVRGLISRDTITCPTCGDVIHLKKLKRAIDDLARIATALDKMTDQSE